MTRSMRSGSLVAPPLASELDAWTARWWRHRVIDRVLIAAGAASALGLGIYALDRSIELPLAMRLPMLTIAVACGVWWTRRELRHRRPKRASFVAGVCRSSGELALLLSGAELEAGDRHAESQAMRAAVVAQARSFWRSCDPAALVRGRQSRGASRLAAGMVVLVALLAALWPLEATRFFQRWGLLQETLYPRESRATVSVPRAEVIEGSDVRVHIEVAGPPVDAAWLWLREADGSGFERRLRARRLGANRFEVTIEDIARDLDVAAIAGDDTDGLPRRRISVWPKPVLEEVSVVVEPPEYSGLEPRRQAGGEIVALPGSRLRVRARTQGDVAQAHLIWAHGEAIALDGGPRHFEGQLPVREAGRFRIRLRDPRGAETTSAAEWTVRLAIDHAPEVRLDWDGQGAEITPRANLRLTARAFDDFALAELRLVVRTEERAQSGRIPVSGREARRDIPWSDEAVRPGDEVELELHAIDGRRPEPQTSAPARRVFRVVEPGALLRRVLDALIAVRSRLDPELPPDVQMSDARELSRLAVTLEQNGVGGVHLIEAIRLAAEAVDRASNLEVASERRAPIARAIEILSVIADWGEITWRLQALGDRQEAIVRELRVARRELASGHRLEVDWPKRAEAERVVAEDADRVALALDHLGRRQPAEAVIEAFDLWQSERPVEWLLGAAEAMERIQLFEALEAATRALDIIRACADRLARAEDSALEGTLADPEDGRGPSSRLSDLLEELEEQDAELESGRSLSDEELARLLEEIERVQKELAEAAAAPEDAPAEEGEAVASDEEELEQAHDDARRALRNAKLARSLELQEDGIDATRRAMKRYLEALERRFDHVSERDASRQALGQNMSGEYTSERLESGTADGLFPEWTPERAKAQAERWGERERRAPIELELESQLPPQSIRFEELRKRYTRELARRLRE
ncbi:MAG: hypothetical protein RL885_03265 [Planctomycetota bacterium]